MSEAPGARLTLVAPQPRRPVSLSTLARSANASTAGHLLDDLFLPSLPRITLRTADTTPSVGSRTPPAKDEPHPMVAIVAAQRRRPRLSTSL